MVMADMWILVVIRNYIAVRSIHDVAVVERR